MPWRLALPSSSNHPSPGHLWASLPKASFITSISMLWSSKRPPSCSRRIELPLPSSYLHFRCSASSSTVEDITEFLLSRCDICTAPKHIDEHIGPITIKRTSDGRGRGLFATTDVSPGHLLLVSNALASSHDDSHCKNLFENILGALRNSPRNLFLYYLLADQKDQNARDVPTIELFKPHWSSSRGCSDRSSLENPSVPMESFMHLDPFDEKRIFDIMHINSFETRLVSLASEVPIRLNAMYLLPSLINHSCTPNASRLFVGDAMFVFAARSIRKNEEITIEYIDTLLPLRKREEYLRYIGYGLRCECKRCVFERSLQDHLEECSKKFIDLYDKAFEEVCELISTRTGSFFPVCEELAIVYDTVKQRMMGFEHLTSAQKQWILAGYSSSFLGNWFTKGLSVDFVPPSEYVNRNALELLEAMKATVPGMQHTLSFATLLGAIASREDTLMELSNEAFKMAMDECIRLYGTQQTNVVIELLQQSLERAPF